MDWYQFFKKQSPILEKKDRESYYNKDHCDHCKRIREIKKDYIKKLEERFYNK